MSQTETQAIPVPAWIDPTLDEEWLSEGPTPSPTALDSNSSTKGGTFLIREDVPPQPVTPAAKFKQGNKYQPLMKDFFSPLALERMFDPPSPPRASTSAETTAITKPISIGGGNSVPAYKPSALANAIIPETLEEVSEEQESERSMKELLHQGEEDMELEADGDEEGDGDVGRFPDEILATDIPGLAEFDGRKPSTNFKFTFHVPPQQPRSQAPSPSLPPSPKDENPSPLPPTSQESDRRLRLFHVYDSYTKNQLSALVDSIAIKSSPTSGNEGDNSSPLLYHNRKRIKLSPVDDDDENIGALRNKPTTKRDFLRESQNLMQMIKEARSLSMVTSDADQSGKPEAPLEDESQPDLSESESSHPPTPPHPTPVLPSFPPTPASLPPERTALAYRLQAANLMAQIKSDMHSKRRIFSWETDNKENLDPEEQEPEQKAKGEKKERKKTDPSPRKLLRRLSAADEVDKELEADRSNVSSGFGSFRILSPPAEHPQEALQVMDENERGIREISARLEHVRFQESAQSSIASSSSSSSSLSTPQNPIEIVLNSPTATHTQQLPPSRPFPSNPALLSQPQLRLPTTLSPHGQEDLNRFVSSSTATSSLSRMGSQVSSGTAESHVKHAGTMPEFTAAPVGGVRRIAPEDVGAAFKRVGGMVYDEVQMKWVKETNGNRNAGGENNAGETTETDVFGDIESLKSFDGDENVQASENGANGPDHEFFEEQREAELDEHWAEEGEEDIEEAPPSEKGAEPQQGASGTPHSRSKTPFQFPPQPSSYETPLTRPRSQTQSIGTAPRSVLKQTPSLRTRPDPVTPFNNDTGSAKGKHRRSVSFSDGRKEGRIIELHRDDPPEGPSGVPSTQTKRILGALDELIEDDDAQWDHDGFKQPFDDTPSKPPTRGSAELARLSSLSRSQSLRSFPFVPASHSKGKQNATFLTEASFKVTLDNLVRLLTSVEPFEPYWEALTEIDLSGKATESVHRLKEFMPVLENIKLDENKLEWLSGIPSSVRMLSVSSNILTSMTAYSHLPNLEYLNISQNQIDSVRQLESLRHLRELKADRCDVTSFDGLRKLENLTRLSLRGNKIVEVDFDKCRWPRLEAIDLSQNIIRSVAGLSSLVSLTSLNLDHNAIPSLRTTSIMSKLRYLRLSNNRLTQLDASHFPNVRTLYADNNKLGEIKQATRLTKLENLSLRNQRGGTLKLATRDIRDVKRLYLSGNPLDGHFLQEPCYNLIYLELASCRLSSLPSDLSILIPNIRVLNLNYNFLTDVRPLEGLVRLRKLTAIGSRLKGTKPLLRTLQRMPDMELVDFRMNPFTLGWYLPLIVKDASGATRLVDEADSHSSTWQDMDAKFRHDLPDESYVGRLAYRGLAMRACPRIRILDGVEVRAPEKDKAEKLLNGIRGTKAKNG